MSARSDVRRTKASAAARLKPFWILIVFAIVAMLAVAAFAVAWPGFAPKKIVVSGNRIVARAEIVDRAHVSMVENMWLQDARAIAARVETIPYVAQATVHRKPPSTIGIWITERMPFAIVQSGDRAALVDRDLRVLGPVLPAWSGLVRFLIDPGVELTPGRFLIAQSALDVRDGYDALVSARLTPDLLELDRYGGLVVTMRDGVVIELGDNTDMSRKLALIGPILDQVAAKDHRVAEIDLRAPNTPVVRYYK